MRIVGDTQKYMHSSERILLLSHLKRNPKVSINCLLWKNLIATLTWIVTSPISYCFLFMCIHLTTFIVFQSMGKEKQSLSTCLYLELSQECLEAEVMKQRQKWPSHGRASLCQDNGQCKTSRAECIS